MTGYSFQTRARTIDHLGRGQIADSPTAISELWKNAYDAYARSVSLHIFDGMPEVAAIFDDGVGMDKDDFLTKWLVIGTESKVETTVDPTREPPETFGLRPRPRQGEKGIGRLSAAFLAPCTLVVSKKRDGGYVVVIVDWRLFENPYLALSDIVVPIEEFEHPEDILPGLEGMIATIRGNLGGEGDDGQTTLAHALEIAWDRFSAQETEAGRSSTTRDAVRRTWASLPLNDGHLEEWPVFLGEGDHGTALFLIEIQDDLRAWLHPDSEDEKPVRDRLRETLTGFTDPFVPYAKSDETELKGGERARLDFDYEVLVRSNGRNISVLRTDAIFGLDNLHGLEHHLDGAFDADGLFEGKVVAYGRDLGIQRIPPPTVMTRSDREQIGPFAFCIGTFEQEEIRSTHQGSEFAALMAKSQEFAGIAVYRDGLRVMPYGRHDSDFFAIEERRTKHTGREFWSHRRSFGRVAFTRRGNPNLKDKAGREGLVDNKAKALLRSLVVNVLRTSARNYFGSDSDLRKNYLPEIEARNAAARKSAERLTKRRRTDVRGFLREQAPLLTTSLAEVKQLKADAAETLQAADRERAAIVLSRYRDLSSVRDNLRPPPAPANMKDAEAKYRSYRDDYREYLASLAEVSQISVKIEAEVGSLTPEETAKTVFSRNQSLLTGRIDGQIKALEGKIEELRNYWRNQASEDRRRYYESNRDIMSGDIEALGLARILNILDRSRLDLEEEVGNRYRAILASVDSLLQGIDLEGAAIVASDDAAALEERVRDIHAVALSGIAVEIIGHELEALDGETRRYLLKLPEPVRQSSAFKLGFEAHNALADKLRVLSPLKIAGYRNRETIGGGQIADYVEEFFANNFSSNRIGFKASEAFRSIEISDLKSRIYPVFINIVNNAAYWCTRSDDRRIILDLRDGKAVIGDTGPGVDPDDVERIFDLFYTRRFGGRGVGLYLCRVNLGVAGHSIRYATESDPHILPGANFIIEFKGLGKNA